jgi:hypothetical protein
MTAPSRAVAAILILGAVTTSLAHPAPAAAFAESALPKKSPQKPIKPKPPIVSQLAKKTRPKAMRGAFANCAAARAAGAAPVRIGEPGYGPHLDRDNDGIGCEPFRGR